MTNRLAVTVELPLKDVVLSVEFPEFRRVTRLAGLTTTVVYSWVPAMDWWRLSDSTDGPAWALDLALREGGSRE